MVCIVCTFVEDSLSNRLVFEENIGWYSAAHSRQRSCITIPVLSWNFLKQDAAHAPALDAPCRTKNNKERDTLQASQKTNTKECGKGMLRLLG